MEEEKGIVNNEKYEKVTPRIGYYMKSKNIARIFKYKSPLFATGGWEKKINLFSNPLEHMGYFSGHDEDILCLCAISTQILASGSDDDEGAIKIWNIEDRSFISTLFGHKYGVSALCSVKEGVFVSGSRDKTLAIWIKSTFDVSTYEQVDMLEGHRSKISGIIRLSNTEIMSGESEGDLRIWNIDEGGESVCIRHIPREGVYEELLQMKQHIGGDVVVSYRKEVKVWGAANDWDETPIKRFKVCKGHAIEFLDGDLLLRGGVGHDLEFIDYGEIGYQLHPIIMKEDYDVFDPMFAIKRIAKNIVITATEDGYLKVIDPMSRNCYLKFEDRESLKALAYFY